jgi:hypothetical protein
MIGKLGGNPVVDDKVKMTYEDRKSELAEIDRYATDGAINIWAASSES